MAKQVCLSVVIDMPDDPFSAAEVYATIKAPWHALADGLNAASLVFVSKIDEMEVRPKVGRRPRSRPRLAAVGSNTPDTAA